MPLPPCGRIAQPAIKKERGEADTHDQVDAIRAHEIAGADQRLGNPRELPLARLEYRHDLRYDEGHQAAHDREAHDAQHDGVEHGRQDFLAHTLATLGVVREPLQHAVEVAGLLAGRNGGAIDFRKDFRKLGEAVGKRVALHDAGPHPHHDTLYARLLGLLRDRQ